jgi:glycosyltransferase involved in cell wall biosynthesis
MYYLSNERIPGPSACSIQQMHMCESFARAGVPLRLVRPYYFGKPDQEAEVLDFYGLEHNFHIMTLPSLLSLSRPDQPHVRGIPGIGGLSMLASSWLLAMKLMWGHSNETGIIYSRNINATWAFLRVRRLCKRAKSTLILYEVHSARQQPERFFRYILQHCDGLVCITHALKRALVKNYALQPERIFVSPDGVPAARIIEPHFSANDARLVLGIAPQFKNVVVYTGQILPGKGVDIFIKAAPYLGDEILLLIVGGQPEQVAKCRSIAAQDHLTNLHFTGFVPPWRVESYQQAADVLVLPNTMDSNLSAFTSPLKLFEYMAAEKPIVASDLPVFHEILQHKENAWLVNPGDPLALAEGIKEVLSNAPLARQLAQRAFTDAGKYSWDQRAERILNFIEKLAATR